jgi:hypothetical protein
MKITLSSLLCTIVAIRLPARRGKAAANSWSFLAYAMTYFLGKTVDCIW